MFMFYEENQVEKEHVKMLYKGPVEDKVEMLEDVAVKMVSPILLEDDKSRIQKSSFLVHLKVSEDSQEKTGGLYHHTVVWDTCKHRWEEDYAGL